MLPWIHMSAMNDRDNVVFININSSWGTVSQRSGMTEREVFPRMLCNVPGKHRAVQQACLSLAAEERLHIESSGCCQENRVGVLGACAVLTHSMFLCLPKLFVDHTFACKSSDFLSIYRQLYAHFNKIPISNEGLEKKKPE